MDDIELMQLALGISSPWYITEVELNIKQRRIDIYIDFLKGSRFSCECGEKECKVYDTREREWRHLDFFQYKAYLHSRVPRIECYKCGVKQVKVPWAREGSGFTLLFEALLLQLAKEMSVLSVSRHTEVNPDSVWRILGHYVNSAIKETDLSKVKKVGLDECSKQKGHKYITTFCDLDEAKVIYVAEGKDANTVKEFKEHLEAHKGSVEQIEQVCCDMSVAYISGVEKNLPKAKITFDKYHVMALINEAVDEVRRDEVKENSLLKDTRYIWLKNPENLTEKQRDKFTSIKGLDLKTAKAYQIKIALQRLWEYKYCKVAQEYLKSWYNWAIRSRIHQIKEVAKTIKRHWDGILAFIESRISNGIVEGINSKIKTALKRAYGFKSFEYYKTIIYLIAGKLNFKLPTQC